MKKKLIPAILSLLLCVSALTMPASAYVQGAPDGEAPSASASADPEQTKPFTPDGQATVTDNATDGDGKEFYTITTPNENVFYLVIDKQREDNNVYFLNAVTEADLMALTEKSKGEDTETKLPDVCACKDKCAPGAVDTTCPVCLKTLNACTAKAVEPAPDTAEPEPPKQERGGGPLIFVLLAVAAAGGAGWYFKVYKPKKDLDSAEDLDELLSDGDEQTVNEDEYQAAPMAAEARCPAPSESVEYDDYPDSDAPDGDGPGEPEE